MTSQSFRERWNRGGTRRRPRQTPRKLSLEPLEDRAVPSAIGHNTFADGKVTTPFSGAQVDSASSVLVEPDGKVVTVGNSGNAIALARYTAAGALDTSFGNGGEVTTTIPGDVASATAAALQADGKILVAGFHYNPNMYTGTHFVVARYTAAGALDTTFGSGGEITVLQNTTGPNPPAVELAVEQNGEIVVAGSNFDSNTSTESLVVEGYTAAGAPDAAFGSNGRTTTAIGPSGGVSGIALQNGAIIVAGVTTDPSTSKAEFVVGRYSATGALDTTFGSGGLASLAYAPDGKANARGVAVGPDGSIVVGGNTFSFSPTFTSTAVVARFTANGTADTTFGSGGLAFTSSASESAVAVQGDVVMVGHSGGLFAIFPQFAVVRFTAQGGPDGGFGSGGTVTTAIGSAASVSAVALQRDGRIVAAGTAFVPATGNDFALARYTTTGGLDAGFGSGGVVTTNFEGPVGAFANSVVTDRGGNFLVAGTTGSAGGSLSVTRYRANGALDNGFGDGGTVQVTFNPYPPFGARGDDGYVAVQQDGKIVLVGTSIEPGTTSYDFALARLLPNGNLDPKFGSGGTVTTFSGARFTDMAPSGGVVIQPDGKILVAGYTEYYGAGFPYVDKGVVERYNSDGSLDTTFGNGGRVTLDLGSGPNRVTSFALEPDGKILVGGFVTDPITFNQTYFLERLQSNGVADATFGTGGLILTNFSGGFSGFGYQGVAGPLTIEPDGKILVGGGTFDPVTLQTYLTVARFTAGGVLDSSYGTGGEASVSFGGDPNFTFVAFGGMTLQSDGKVVVVGTNVEFDPNTSVITLEYVMARFTATGTLDTSFGKGGKVDTGINGSNFEQLFAGPAVLVQQDGAIVVAGSTYDPIAQVYDYVLEEFNADGSLVFGEHKK